MATLLPTLLSDDEEDGAITTTKGDKSSKAKTKKQEDEDEEEEDDEVDGDFEFGGLLGEDEDGVFSSSSLLQSKYNSSMGNVQSWSYKSALELLARNDTLGPNVERTSVASIIAAARHNLKKSQTMEEEEEEEVLEKEKGEILR
uniref:Uncharacterized protein n=1 Tax=Ditylum brightwellii TaxID=49249 RepID=A0A6U3V9G0_9STRA|mmetsp:Transcript_7206/g.10860  ORF Transcript_7206/g.10860 Transcript_7206/m.10860 type:complete len:144 (+) Transcript_7206:155-586(+)